MFSVIGHEREVAYLQRSLQAGRLSHAYLLVGPEHVGKMTLALALAQALNCTAEAKPCGECAACRKIAAQSHPDVMVLRLRTAAESDDKKAKSEVVIDQIRDLQHWASLPPFEGRERVFIFERAELMNTEAANCLLKTLEEPLPHVRFLLLAASPEALPETIVSRCQKLELRALTPAVIEETLRGRGLPPERAKLLARLSRGAPGWALTAVEDEALLSARQERARALLALVRQGYDERFEYAGELAGKGGQGRGEVQRVLELWQDLWRDLMLLKTGLSEAITNLDMQDDLVATSAGLSLADIRRFLLALRAAARQLGQNVNPRLLLEVLMLDMPRLGRAK